MKGEKMKVYIAGKISGDPNYKDKFEAAKKVFEKDGFIVLQPAILPEGMTPADYMRICFAMIDSADAVVFLKDWNDSKGAKLEHEYCGYIHKPIFFVE